MSLGVTIDGSCVLEPIARVAMRECGGVSRNAVVRATPRREVEFAERARHSFSCQIVDKGDNGFRGQGPRKEFRLDGLISAFGIRRAWRLQSFAGPIGPVTKALLAGHLLYKSSGRRGFQTGCECLEHLQRVRSRPKVHPKHFTRRRFYGIVAGSQIEAGRHFVRSESCPTQPGVHDPTSVGKTPCQAKDRPDLWCA